MVQKSLSFKEVKMLKNPDKSCLPGFKFVAMLLLLAVLLPIPGSGIRSLNHPICLTSIRSPRPFRHGAY